MRARMQPISSILSTLPRFVRDLAVTSGKELEIEIEGQETDLDKSVLEAIKTSLLHLVRNAVDHGIETPEDRETAAASPAPAGSPSRRSRRRQRRHRGPRRRQGPRLRADPRAGDVGRDRESRRRRRSAAAPRSSSSSFGRVSRPPGRSPTSPAAGSVSMSFGPMWRASAASSRCSPSPRNRRPSGSRSPSPWPSSRSFSFVRADSDSPCPRRPSSNSFVSGEASSDLGIEQLHGVPVYRLRGRLLPLVTLSEELGLASPGTGSEESIIVLQGDNRQFGLLVDSIDDSQEIVVKPLGRRLTGLPFAGATILGDGSITLILDVFRVGLSAGVVSDDRVRALIGGSEPPVGPGPGPQAGPSAPGGG